MTNESGFEQLLLEATEDDRGLDDTQLARAVAMQSVQSNGNLAAAVEDLAGKSIETKRELEKASRERDELIAALEEIQRRLHERPVLMQVRSLPFEFSKNGNGEVCQRIFLASIGEASRFTTLELEDGIPAPEPLEYVLTDAECKFLLATAPRLPMQQLAESNVRSTKLSEELPGYGQVVIGSGEESGHGLPTQALWAKADVVNDIQSRLDNGERVVVQHTNSDVQGVDSEKIEWTQEAFVEFISRDGPTLNDMKLHPSTYRELRDSVDDMREEKGFQRMFSGPTGLGKTSGVYAALRTAAEDLKKEIALINICSGTVSSMWYGQSEQNIRRAFRAFRKLKAEGYLVAVLFDEMDQLLGAADGRHESNVDRRIRLSLQQILAESADMFIFATMNTASENCLGAPISRRFRKVAYGAPTRQQLAQIFELYIEPEVALSVSAAQFGQQASDFLCSDHFVVARAHLYSGTVIPVRARDLHEACPGKVKSMCEAFSTKVKRGSTNSIESLFEMLEHEFHAVHLTASSIQESTFIKWDPNDPVKAVERVAAS